MIIGLTYLATLITRYMLLEGHFGHTNVKIFRVVISKVQYFDRAMYGAVFRSSLGQDRLHRDAG